MVSCSHPCISGRNIISEDELLIPEEARAMIGKEAPPIVGYPVPAHEIREFSFAVGDLNPLWVDADYAENGPHGGIVAPPLFFFCPFDRSSSLDQLEPDGTPHPGSDALRPPLPVHRRMLGGEEIEFFQRVRPGDVLTEKSKIADIYQKVGRNGNLVFTVRDYEYTNQHGELVAKRRFIHISR